MVKRVVQILTTLYRPLAVVIGSVLIFFLAAIWISALVGIIFGFPYFEYFLPNVPFITAIGITNVLVIIGVPVLMLIFMVTRIAFRTPRMNRKWVAGTWALWTLNIISFFIFAPFVAREFTVEKEINAARISPEATIDTLHLIANPNPYQDALINFSDAIISDNKMITENIVVHIQKSKSGKFEISESRISRGRKPSEATQLANSFEFQSSLDGAKLQINSYLAIPKGDKWRAQRVILTVGVPEGKYLHIGDNTDRFIREADIDTDLDHPWPSDGQLWLMTPKGLVLPGFEGSESNDELSFTDFDNLIIKGKLKVLVERSDDFSVRVDGKPVYQNKVNFQQLGQTLTIDAGFSSSSSPVRLSITCPDLKWLELDNTDDVTLSGFDASTMQLIAKGKFEVKSYDLHADTLRLKLSDRAKADLRGKGQFLDASLDENIVLNAEYFDVHQAWVRSTDPKNRIKISVSDTLKRKSPESTNWSIEGTPVIVDME